MVSAPDLVYCMSALLEQPSQGSDAEGPIAEIEEEENQRTLFWTAYKALQRCLYARKFSFLVHQFYINHL